MDEQKFRQIISGDAKGLTAACLRSLLSLASLLYGIAVRFRNRCYDAGIRKTASVSVPVIAVGNLTTGGTGKTPVVGWIVNQLNQNGFHAAIISRGYGADADGINDEKRVLQLVCPQSPHIQKPDRVAAATEVIHDHHADVVVCDDAFQHRRIDRDLNIVLIDATNPFGYGRLLPRGLLREPVTSLKRADAVLVTRCDSMDAAQRQQLEHKITSAAPHLAQQIFYVRFAPAYLINSAGQQNALHTVAGQRVAVVTAIGNPQAFLKTCEQLQVDVCGTRFFPDHHLYTADDVAGIEQLRQSVDADCVLTTVKDLVKLPGTLKHVNAVHIETEFETRSQQQALAELLNSAVTSHATQGGKSR